MEYASFVRDLRKESYNAFPPDTQYAKQFEEQMQALVTNFDIDDTKLEPHQQQHFITSTPLATGSGMKWNTGGRGKVANAYDETERMEVPKKKKALDIAQKMSGDHELPGSFDSSEGISMCFDSCSSSDGIPDMVIWNESATDLSASGSVPTREAQMQHHPHTPSFPFEAIQGQDSLLEPSADISSNDRKMFATKLCTPAKRTYDEANS
uniref:Uncharacterized protein n=1 Tax=Anopheles minimus TaxID=112268 RepID=A0A182WAG6_9DIPT